VQPTAFISYSWDSESHRAWVRLLAEQLQASGVKVSFDQWDVSPGSELPQFMETSIRESDYVVLVCTENFAAKANSGGGGVGYEKAIVTGEVIARISPDTKFVPILRSGNHRTALPSFLISKVFIDFRRDGEFDNSFETLLRHLHSAPEFRRPLLGPKPAFESQAPVQQHSPSDRGAPTVGLATFERLFAFAYASGGMNLPKEQAVVWSEGQARKGPGFDLEEFKKRYFFAYGSGGMNLHKDGAIAWAERQQGPGFDLEEFKKRYFFAYGSGGMNLNKDQAIRWAEDQSTMGRE